MANVIGKEKARFRIVIHELAKKKTKTVSLVDGGESLSDIEAKIRGLFG